MTNASISSEQHAPDIGSRREQRGNIIRLSLAQALAGANSTVIYATGAIIGATLAPDKALATLPISIFVVGMAACILPTGMIARHHGRRAAFLAGTVTGVLSGLIAALAVIMGSFWLFCLATFFGGSYAAVVLSFRFAAADCVEPEWRPRALSIVMAGGVAAGVVGPQLVTYTMNLWPPHMFAATFIAQAGSPFSRRSCSPACGSRCRRSLKDRVDAPFGDCPTTALHHRSALRRGVLHADEFPDDRRAAGDADVRAQPGKLQPRPAMACHRHVCPKLLYRTAHYPLRGWPGCCGRTGADWRVIGCRPCGDRCRAFLGDADPLGVGWNFGFIGASALVLECHRPEEKTKVQALNDFLVFGTMAVGSFSSGGLLASHGWSSVLWVSFAPLALAVAALGLAAMARPVPSTEREGA
ncbi:MFS transporter [Novosphingobium panipatense]